jgi:glycosyltransferase involved in cell wall biosynthesis
VAHLHGMFSFWSWGAAAACSAASIPYLARPAGSLCAWSLRQGAAYKRAHFALFDRRALDGAAAVHCTSREEASDVARLGVRAPRAVIPLGVAPVRAARGQWRSKLGIGDETALIAFVSRLHRKKGLEALVRAASDLRAAGKDLFVAVAGSGEAGYAESLEKQARLALGDRIAFLGFVEGDRKYGLLADADIFALPSHHENYGLAVVEAMACGTPVLVTEAVGVSPEVREGGAGQVIAGNRADQIRAGLDALLEGRRFASLRQAAARVAAGFDLERCVERLRQAYEAAAAGRPIAEAP